MPGPIAGFPSTAAETAAYHALSIESILGLPFRAFATLVIGWSTGSRKAIATQTGIKTAVGRSRRSVRAAT
jgi:hypothetical protein